MALRIEHPDLHWYFPIRKPATKGSRERDREALEDVRMDTLAEMRTESLRPTPAGDARGLHLGTIQNLLREASKRPALTARRLFLIAQAEELVPQESSPEAANALLKVLEEPPDDTWFILTSSEPGRLLSTIRSRAMSLHVRPLPQNEVEAFLVRHDKGSEEEVARAAALSGGSIGRALGYLPDGEVPGPLEQIRKDAFFLLKAALDPNAAERFAQAVSLAPTGARGLHELLTALERWIRDLAVAGCSKDAHLLNQDAVAWLRRMVTEKGVHPVRASRSVNLVESARGLAAGNVNPQLLMNHLLTELHEELLDPHELDRG